MTKSKIKIFLDPVGNTMNIWWGDPMSASISEETEATDNNDVIVKNKRGIPIGLEIIGVFPEELNITKLMQEKYPFVAGNEPFLIETIEESVKIQTL